MRTKIIKFKNIFTLRYIFLLLLDYNTIYILNNFETFIILTNSAGSVVSGLDMIILDKININNFLYIL